MALGPSTRSQHPWYVGAYALFPKGAWQETAEAEILDASQSLHGFTGWEVPFNGRIHSHEDWFLDRIGDRATLVLTLIPGVMSRLSDDPRFGIASSDEDARLRAVRFVLDARNAVNNINDRLGRRAVAGIELHSSPRADAGSSRAALERSLLEIVSWQWEGAVVLLEHCDALNAFREPQKGFLSLDDELAALERTNRESGSDIRCLINWGRSAIEGHDVATPPAHIARARSAGLLGGVMFSGSSDNNSSRGGAWADFHLPPTAALANDEKSLLDADATRKAIDAAGELDSLTVLGMKISAPPDASLGRRLEILRLSSAALRP
jgi:Domain of unknown function (DUF4862)